MVKQNIKLNLTATVEFKKQLAFLLSSIRSTEWGGIVFYSIQGDFLSNSIKISLKEIVLMDIGTAASTEHTYDDEDFSEACMKRIGQPYGLIHSHANMAVFYSATDEKELINNVEFYPNGYLSVVVNNQGEILARFLDIYPIEHTIKLFDKRGLKHKTQTIHEDAMIYAEEKIHLFGDSYDSTLAEKIKELRIIKAKKEKESKQYNKKGIVYEEYETPKTLVPGQY